MKIINHHLITIILTIFISSIFYTQNTAAEVNVVTSTPDLASITKEIGKDKVDVESLSKGYQDPHFVDAKPNYVLKLNKADLLIYIGLDLETGWLPVLVNGSRNSKIISRSSKGNLDASKFVDKLLDVPEGPIDRSMGDVHPGGNPHYLLDPRNGIAVANGISKRLGEIDPENGSFYNSNYQDFRERMLNKISGWKKDISSIEGSGIVTYHRLWAYFFEWSGFKDCGTIEPKPGIPPSPSHLVQLIENSKSGNVKIVISANYYPDKTAKIVAEKIGVPFLSLPVMTGGVEKADNYPELFDVIISGIKKSVDK